MKNKFKLMGLISFVLLVLSLGSCKNQVYYKVFYDSQGGSSVATETVQNGKYATEPTDPTKEGYTFEGWYVDVNFKLEFNFNTPITGNTVLYAKWESSTIVNYLVVLDACGGRFENEEATISLSIQEGNALGNVELPTLTNFSFAGWYSDSSYSNLVEASFIITRDITLYAKWEEVINTLSFFTAGGSEVDSQYLKLTDKTVKPQAPQKAGYVFKGWYEAGATEAFEFGGTISSDIVLYASWEKQTFKDALLATNVVISDDFNSYTSISTLPTFSGAYGTKGIYYNFNNKNNVGDSTTNYIKLGDNVAEMIDQSNDGTQMIIDFGKEIKSNIVEGYLDLSLVNQGDSWTFMQFYGIDFASQYVEVLGLRTVNGLIKYRLNGSNDQIMEAITPITAQNTEYKIHYIFNLSTGQVYLELNDDVMINNESLNITSLAAIKLVSSDNNQRSLIVDNVIVTNNNEVLEFDDTLEHTVTFDTNGGSSVDAIIVVENNLLAKPQNPTLEGYEFVGWFIDEELTTSFAFTTPITSDITLYAKWRSTAVEATKYTVTFDTNGGSTIDAVEVEELETVTQPAIPTKEGYLFIGWYYNNVAYDFNTPITANITLVAKWSLVTSVDLAAIKQEAIYELGDYAAAKLTQFDETIDAAIIASINAEVLDSTTLINACQSEAAVNQKLKEAKDAIDTLIKDYYLNKGDEGTVNSIAITVASGNLESAYIEWLPVQDATTYDVYYKERDALDTAYKLIDKMLIRKYPNNYRADVLGLKAGEYTLKVVPTINGNFAEFSATADVSVLAHDRSGYAFVNGSSSGGYNDDGTPKSNAVILYITENTKDTITMSVQTSSKGTMTECVGLQNIITGFKKQTDNRPLIIRLIGNITDFAVMNKGDLLFDNVINGITLEGVGNDATANGWGIRIKGSSNVEIRNIGLMNCNSSEGDNIGLQQDNDHIWIHNNDFFYGDAGSDSDQAKGDGALDTKTSTYVTHSYNHFWDCGKCNLQGMKEETTSNYITYHHNWYDHSDSRHPRVRTCTVHVYNNYFDGNAKYGIGATMGSSVFVENNYFRNCKNPMLTSLQGTDALGDGTFSGENGGFIKAYGNYIEGGNTVITHLMNATSFDCYLASSRYEQVSSSYVALVGGTTYNNFDTASDFYEYKLDTPEDAVINVKLYSGRVQGGDFKYTFNNSVDDISYDVNTVLKSALVNYSTALQKILGEN